MSDPKKPAPKPVPKRSGQDQPEDPRLTRIRELERAGVGHRTPEESEELARLLALQARD